MNADGEKHIEGNFHAVSLSGGKDSTAMLLLMIEQDMPIDVVLTADTGSPLDAAIADEFRGTANMELYLNADGTINLRRSLTRKADLMQSEDAQKAAAALRAAIAQDDLVQAQQRMADLLAQTEDFDALVTQLSHPSES